jgi:hypothetical protein
MLARCRGVAYFVIELATILAAASPAQTKSGTLAHKNALGAVAGARLWEMCIDADGESPFPATSNERSKAKFSRLRRQLHGVWVA